jgi:hypothetical protein
MGTKPKKKEKGKKTYKNTHGTRYRVLRGYRLKRAIKQRKILREMNTQKASAS